jgi:hypothetical protein
MFPGFATLGSEFAHGLGTIREVVLQVMFKKADRTVELTVRWGGIICFVGLLV